MLDARIQLAREHLLDLYREAAQARASAELPSRSLLAWLRAALQPSRRSAEVIAPTPLLPHDTPERHRPAAA